MRRATLAFLIGALTAGVIVVSVRDSDGPCEPAAMTAPGNAARSSFDIATVSDPDRELRFDGAAGTAPDPAVWNFDTGGTGWGNNELQNYTNKRNNSALDGHGNLVITARRERSQFDDATLNYTSARLTTQGKVTIDPASYVEATIQAQPKSGVWPAFWLMGIDLPQVGWPQAGELDVMEVFGSDPALNQYIHVSASDRADEDAPYGGRSDGGRTPLVGHGNQSIRVGVYFDEQRVQFFVDRRRTLSITAEQAAASGRDWPFDRPFFILLNVAVGGQGGDPKSTEFPRTMTVGPISIWSGFGQQRSTSGC